MHRLILDSVDLMSASSSVLRVAEKDKDMTSSPKQATKRTFLTWRRLHFAIFEISLSHSAKPVPKDGVLACLRQS